MQLIHFNAFYVQIIPPEITSSSFNTEPKVNSAGILSRGTIETATLDDYDKVMNTNMRFAFHANFFGVHLFNVLWLTVVKFSGQFTI